MILPSTGLHRVSSPDLEALLRECQQGFRLLPWDQAQFASRGLAHLAPHLTTYKDVAPGDFVLLLQAVLLERSKHMISPMELVWTGPEANVSFSRDTAVVVQQLFASAQHEVIIAGYSFDSGPQLFASLHQVVVARNVAVTMYRDIPRAPNHVDVQAWVDHHMQTFLSSHWPENIATPTMCYDPRTVAFDALASLHAKCIVVDGHHAFVGSANFTDRGQRRNIEVGVLIHDAAFSALLAAQWSRAQEIGVFKRWSPLKGSMPGLE